MAWFRKSKRPDPAAASRELRQQALSVKASDLGLSPGGSKVWGVIMETAFPEAVVTLVSFAEGTTSLYFSSGGGTIGAGEHAAVRSASQELLQIANDHLATFSPAREFPLPTEGRVRFYVHTFDGVLTAERDEEELGEERDPLSPVFHAAHAVIAAVREVDES
jgi:hypothetical protein